MEEISSRTVSSDSSAEQGMYRDICERALPMIVLGISVIMFGGTLTKKVLPPLILGQLAYMALGKNKITMTPETAPTSKKQEKKLQQQIKRMSGREQYGLMWNTLTEELIYKLEFSDDLDSLLAAGMIILINVVAAVILKLFFIPTYPFSIIIVTILGYGAIFLFLVKVEWSHAVISRADKLSMFLAGIMGTFVAFSLLMYVPANSLPFDTAAASQEWLTAWDKVAGARFTARLNAAAAALGLEATAQPPVKMDNAFAIAAPLALVAGMLSALLMSPGLRYGRVLHQLLNPPLWARNFRAGSTLVRCVARAGFALQVLAFPLWVNPLTDVFQLPEPTLRYLRAVTLLVASLLQAVVLPALVQSFLFTAPYKIHILGRTPDLPEDVQGRLIRQTAQLTLLQTCKTAMQLYFVPLIMMLCASLYILTAFPSPRAVTDKFTWGSEEHASLYPCCTGFLGWWANSVYIGWASLGILMAKLARTTDT